MKKHNMLCPSSRTQLQVVLKLMFDLYMGYYIRIYERKKMKTKVLKLNKPKTEWVETYQELNILATITGHIDLWHNHYPFKKWVTLKYFPEVDMDKDEFPDDIFSEDDFCDEELIQEWINETKQPFKLISMTDQRGFYFYV